MYQRSGSCAEMTDEGGQSKGNRRSFGCVSRDETARDAAQDDKGLVGLERTGNDKGEIQGSFATLQDDDVNGQQQRQMAIPPQQQQQSWLVSWMTKR
jgi:hypothetical protein